MIAKTATEKVDAFLVRYGWAFRRLPDATWESGWRGSEAFFPLRLTLSSQSLHFHTEIASLPTHHRHCPDLLSFLLQLNAMTKWVKLCLDDNNAIGLRLDLSASELRFERFQHVLGILGYYSDELYRLVGAKLITLSHLNPSCHL